MRAKTSYLRAIRLFLVLLSLCAAVFGIYFCFGQSKGINRSGLTMLNELARQRSCGLCVALESKLQQTPRDITDALKNKDATALAALRRAAADADATIYWARNIIADATTQRNMFAGKISTQSDTASLRCSLRNNRGRSRAKM